MTQPHKTLAEIIELTQRLKRSIHAADPSGYDQVIKDLMLQIDEIIEATELHASQFVKKDETVIDCKYCAELPGRCGMCEMATGQVSSDVEQAAKDYAKAQGTHDKPEITAHDFIQGAKWQSTQQPATINWLTDEEIEEKYPTLNGNGYHFKKNGSRQEGAKWLQSKLKERVNCVDPVEFFKWMNKNKWRLVEGFGSAKDGMFWHPGKMYKTGDECLKLYIDYLKTNPNGQAK